MYYAVPRIFHEQGSLERLYTDICAVKSWPRLLKMLPPGSRPSGVRTLLGRVPRGVPSERLTSFAQFGWTLFRRKSAARTARERLQVRLWAGAEFCQSVVRAERSRPESVDLAYYTFNQFGLEVLKHARSRGARTIMEQCSAPLEVWYHILAEENRTFPDFDKPQFEVAPILGDDAFCRLVNREREECSQADLIVCPSDWVRDAIALVGGPVDRCAVVPYGVDLAPPAQRAPRRPGRLRVLTVGAVSLNKGVQYVAQLAAALSDIAEFRFVGAMNITPRAQQTVGAHLELTGAVPRAEMPLQYEWADVFLLPSVCEGSATAVYEALACGLPVIATRQAGTVVRDSIEGFVVESRDTEAMTRGLRRLAAEPELRAAMSVRALERAAEFTVQRYGERLLDALAAVPSVPA